MDKLKLSAYEIIEVRKIADIESMGYILRHKKSGARVCVISNEDDNKVFSIGFRTPRKMRQEFRILSSIPRFADRINFRSKTLLLSLPKGHSIRF